MAETNYIAGNELSSPSTFTDGAVSEPEIIADLFISEIEATVEPDGTVGFVGMVRSRHPHPSMAERRIVLRFTTSNVLARKLASNLRRALSQGGN